MLFDDVFSFFDGFLAMYQAAKSRSTSYDFHITDSIWVFLFQRAQSFGNSLDTQKDGAYIGVDPVRSCQDLRENEQLLQEAGDLSYKIPTMLVQHTSF